MAVFNTINIAPHVELIYEGEAELIENDLTVEILVNGSVNIYCAN